MASELSAKRDLERLQARVDRLKSHFSDFSSLTALTTRATTARKRREHDENKSLQADLDQWDEDLDRERAMLLRMRGKQLAMRDAIVGLEDAVRRGDPTPLGEPEGYKPRSTIEGYKPRSTIEGYKPRSTIEGYKPRSTIEGYKPTGGYKPRSAIEGYTSRSRSTGVRAERSVEASTSTGTERLAPSRRPDAGRGARLPTSLGSGAISPRAATSELGASESLPSAGSRFSGHGRRLGSSSDTVRRSVQPPRPSRGTGTAAASHASRSGLQALVRRALTTGPKRPGPGMDSKQVAELPRSKLAASRDGNCAICISVLLKGQDVVFLECTHVFHANCISHWLTKKATCPLCVSKVSVP